MDKMDKSLVEGVGKCFGGMGERRRPSMAGRWMRVAVGKSFEGNTSGWEGEEEQTSCILRGSGGTNSSLMVELKSEEAGMAVSRYDGGVV
jgi:hypothetical protein